MNRHTNAVIDASQLVESDVVIEISYEKAVDPSTASNPYALLSPSERKVYDEQQAAVRLGTDKREDTAKN
jgi:hypothetical protein